MEIKVDVGVFLEGKKIYGNVCVSEESWTDDPLSSVVQALQAKYGIEIDCFADDKTLEVDWGETIGKFDMDLTDTLEQEPLEKWSAWMRIDISGNEPDDSEYAEQMVETLAEFFPALRHCMACPVCSPDGGMAEQLRYLVPHLNDQHEWTVGEIADWIETLDLNIQLNENAVAA